MVNDNQTSSAGEEESAAKVAPEETSDEGREDEAHADDEPNVPTMLPLDDLAVREVTHIGNTRTTTRLENDPSDVRPPEAFLRRVWVEVRVGIAVVSAMTARPPLDRALDGAGATEGEEVLKWEGGGVGAVSPEAVVAIGGRRSVRSERKRMQTKGREGREGGMEAGRKAGREQGRERR
jgi:hypothetical protein